jgi:SPP1 family predicted phage head-tail adaptor
MRAGQLRHRVTIERRVQDKDERGQVRESWATRASLWGHVEQLGGREQSSTLGVHPEATWRVTVRFWSGHGIQTGDRINYGGRLLDVLAPPIDVGERRVKLVIDAKEHQTAGGAS